jgi:hypothetical protein
VRPDVDCYHQNRSVLSNEQHPFCLPRTGGSLFTCLHCYRVPPILMGLWLATEPRYLVHAATLCSAATWSSQVRPAVVLCTEDGRAHVATVCRRTTLLLLSLLLLLLLGYVRSSLPLSRCPGSRKTASTRSSNPTWTAELSPCVAPCSRCCHCSALLPKTCSRPGERALMAIRLRGLDTRACSICAAAASVYCGTRNH